jgi:hypothetical protein
MKGCFINSVMVDLLAAEMTRHRSRNSLHDGVIDLGKGGKAFAVIYLKAFSNLGLMSVHGILPVIISITMQPILQVSLFYDTPSWRMTSGAMYGRLSPLQKSPSTHFCFFSPFRIFSRLSYNSANA